MNGTVKPSVLRNAAVSGLDLIGAGIGHEAFNRKPERAIRNDADLEIPDLVSIETRRLLSGERGRRTG
ncbi:hypothetical protein [Bradyrhizobium sp. RDM12]